LAADISHRGFQNGTKFGSLIEGALLYAITQVGELRYRECPWDAKILKGVKIVTLFSYIV